LNSNPPIILCQALRVLFSVAGPTHLRDFFNPACYSILTFLCLSKNFLPCVPSPSEPCSPGRKSYTGSTLKAHSLRYFFDSFRHPRIRRSSKVRAFTKLFAVKYSQYGNPIASFCRTLFSAVTGRRPGLRERPFQQVLIATAVNVEDASRKTQLGLTSRWPERDSGVNVNGTYFVSQA